ncbi:hypothetical protein [Methylobacterium indicum]|uniref:hypothetical protein n=1 Tax=Methylobacterium indicum TaxID=1775910 RepID=UPI002435B692|nr:hypothetical protein [Methylobacterium indicum]
MFMFFIDGKLNKGLSKDKLIFAESAKDKDFIYKYIMSLDSSEDLSKNPYDFPVADWVLTGTGKQQAIALPDLSAPQAQEAPSPIEQLYEALQEKTEIVECWIGYRHLNEKNLDPDRRPTVIAMAPSHEEAFPMMLRLAGLDDAEVKALGLTYAEMDDIHEFCKRLHEACGDTFELVSYDQAA